VKRFVIFYGEMLLIGGSIFAQQTDTLWIRTCGGSDTDCAYSVQKTADLGLMATSQPVSIPLLLTGSTWLHEFISTALSPATLSPHRK